MNKWPNRELTRLCGIINNPVTRPRHPRTRVRPGSTVQVLPIIQRAQRKRPVPLQPPSGVHHVIDVRLQINRPGVLLPRPAEIRFEGRLDRNQIGGGGDFAVEDGDAGVLVRVLSALGGEDVLLVVVGFPRVEVAVLEDDGGVAEDEIDGAVDVALAVELAERVDVESVLVANEAALVKCGEVGAAT